MPIRWAVATGNWSTASIWNSGATLGIPTGSDDVFAGGFTVTLNQDIDVLSLNTTTSGSAPAGGGFSVTGSRNIKANIIRAGTTNCLNISGTSITVNITGSVSGSNVAFINVPTINVTTTSSSINISGSFILGAFGGAGNCPAINANGTLNTYNIIMDSIRAGEASTNNAGILIRGDRETLIVTSSITGSNTNNIGINGISSISNNPYTLSVLGNARPGNQQAAAINLNAQGAGTAGTGVGTFNFSGSIDGSGTIAVNNITASITSSIVGGGGSLPALSISSTSLIGISGNITGGTAANGVNIIANSNIVNITGSCTGGTGAGTRGINIAGLFNQINILGDCIGGPAGSFGQAYGASLGGTFNSIRVNGNVVGSPLSTNLGTGLIIVNATEVTCSIFGDVVPGRFGSGLELRGVNGGRVDVFGDVRGHVFGGLNLGAITFTVTANDRIILNISGSILPGALGSGYSAGQTAGIRFDTTTTNTTVNISGSVFAGGTGSINMIGIQNNSALRFSTINILGNVIAGPTGSSIGNAGITSNTIDNIIIVSGSAIAGSTNAIQNTANNTSITVGTAIASVTASSVSNTGNIPAIYESATFATNGRLPITGPARLRLNDNNFFSCSLDTGGYKTLINVNNISNGLPAASDIRRGTVYNFGDGVGTMAVPSASYVDSGVAVDNTSGTAVYTTSSLATTVWDTSVAALTGSNSVGERLRNISTVSSTGDQLVALL